MLAFFIVLLGCMDLGRYLLSLHAMRALVGQAQHAGVASGLAIGSISGTTCSGTLVSSLGAVLPFTPPGGLDPETMLCVTSNKNLLVGAVTVQVIVQSPFTPLTPGLGALTGPLKQGSKVSY